MGAFARAGALARRLRLNEALPLAVICLVGLCGWAFLATADWVEDGGSMRLDRAILLSFRLSGDPATPLGPGWLQEAARDVTGLGGTFVLTLITAATAIYLSLTGRRHVALFVVVAVAGGSLLGTLLKLGFDRPRPEIVTHAMRVYTASFPSGHAMMSATTYLTLGALLARVHAPAAVKAYFMALAIVLTLLIGLSRLYLGVHWPSDVLAGWSLGAAWAGLCWYIALLLQRHGELERENGEGGPDGVSSS